MSANIVNHNNASNAVIAENAIKTPTKKADDADAGSAALVSPAADNISPKAEANKKTPAKRTPSKRLSYIERAQKESEELVRNMGGTLELEGGRRTRSSARGTPTAQTPPPVKKARSSPATNTPTRGRGGRARKLNTPEIDDGKDEVVAQETVHAVETTPKSKGRKKHLETVAETKTDNMETDAAVSEQIDNKPDTATESEPSKIVPSAANANSIEDHSTTEPESMDTDAAAVESAEEPAKPLEDTVASHKENAMEVDIATNIESKEENVESLVAASDEADAVVAAKDEQNTVAAKTITTTTTVPAVESEISSADTTTTTIISTTETPSKTSKDDTEVTEKHKNNGVSEVEIEPETAAAADTTESTNNNNDAAQKGNAVLETTLAAGDAANKVQNELCEQKQCSNIEVAAAAADVGGGDGVTN